MRILPDHPSLDFLRREAKDVLTALRESEPAATLTEAQRSLAEQYGFRDWATLKAEVDARRAEPPRAPDGLTEELATAFDLGRPTAAATPISYAPMGRRWCIETERGRFVAGTVYDWIDDRQVDTAMELLNAARGAGIAAPEPVRGGDGSWIQRAARQRWRLDTFVEVGPTPLPPVREALARTLGTITASLHDLAIPTSAAVSPYLTSVRPVEDWTYLIDRARAADKPWLDDLAALARTTVADLRTIQAPATTDAIVCHCNLIPENVATAAGDELVVIEWLFAGALTPELEVGAMLPHWFVGRAGVNERGVRAFQEAYAKASERKAAPVLTRSSFAVAAAGWLNWAYNAFCGAIDPQTPDERTFYEREAQALLLEPLTVERIDQLAALTA